MNCQKAIERRWKYTSKIVHRAGKESKHNYLSPKK